MSFGFLNALMLLGLVGLAIPPIIHLLNRRRYDVVDWGAMQFLQISETTRRRLLIEELLLMLLRMGLIGLAVLALAAPFLVTPGLPTIGKRPNRDVVLVFDGSASMGYVDKDGRTPHEAAKDWARTIVGGLAPGDSVTVLLARQQVVPLVGTPSHDLAQVQEVIARLPPPGGTTDLPQAVRQGLRVLDTTSRRPQRELIVLSDGQRFGWADEETLKRWQRLSAEFHEEAAIPPRIWVVNLDPDRPAHPPNWTLSPLRTVRSVVRVGEPLTFQSDLVLHGQAAYQPPYGVFVEIDGRPVSLADVIRRAAPELADVLRQTAAPELTDALRKAAPRLADVIRRTTTPDLSEALRRRGVNDLADVLRSAAPTLADILRGAGPDLAAGIPASAPALADALRKSAAPLADVLPNVEVPARADLRDGRVPIAFEVAFTTPGSHLVSVIVEPDPPGTAPTAERKDRLPVDNRQDFAVEVLPPLPVLLVDGDPRPAPRSRGADLLRTALAPRMDATRDDGHAAVAGTDPVREAAPMWARVVSIADLEKDLALFDRDLEGPGTRPRVVVLCDIADLKPAVERRVEQFLAGGGGVLVTLGDRASEDAYKKLFNQGQGWLPAEPDRVVIGDSGRPVSPHVESFNHQALDLFRQSPTGGLGGAHFRRWWKVTAPDDSAAARLTNRDPLLIEKRYRSGRVLLCTVPLDRSWDSNLPELPAYVVLAHELVNYLANVRTTEYNVSPGQSLRYPLDPGRSSQLLTAELPGGEKKLLAIHEPGASGGQMARLLQEDQKTVVAYDDTATPGVYRVGEGVWPIRGRATHYVVRPDSRDAALESELSPCDETDWKAVGEHLPMIYVKERDPMRSALGKELYRQELWWWFLIGVVLLLCGEIWMTRRLVKKRA
jgi:hypothetical protein